MESTGLLESIGDKLLALNGNIQSLALIHTKIDTLHGLFRGIRAQNFALKEGSLNGSGLKTLIL